MDAKIQKMMMQMVVSLFERQQEAREETKLLVRLTHQRISILENEVVDLLRDSPDTASRRVAEIISSSNIDDKLGRALDLDLHEFDQLDAAIEELKEFVERMEE